MEMRIGLADALRDQGRTAEAAALIRAALAWRQHTLNSNPNPNPSPSPPTLALALTQPQPQPQPQPYPNPNPSQAAHAGRRSR